MRHRESSTLPLESYDDNRPLRPCQTDCLTACAKGAQIIEMACGTGKTRVIKELVRNISGRVPCLVLRSSGGFYGELRKKVAAVVVLNKLRC